MVAASDGFLEVGVSKGERGDAPDHTMPVERMKKRETERRRKHSTCLNKPSVIQKDYYNVLITVLSETSLQKFKSRQPVSSRRPCYGRTMVETLLIVRGNHSHLHYYSTFPSLILDIDSH